MARTQDIRKQGNSVCQYRKQHREPECVPRSLKASCTWTRCLPLCIFLFTDSPACLFGCFLWVPEVNSFLWTVWPPSELPALCWPPDVIKEAENISQGKSDRVQYALHCFEAFSYLWSHRAASCTPVMLNCKMKSLSVQISQCHLGGFPVNMFWFPISRAKNLFWDWKNCYVVQMCGRILYFKLLHDFLLHM